MDVDMGGKFHIHGKPGPTQFSVAWFLVSTLLRKMFDVNEK